MYKLYDTVVLTDGRKGIIVGKTENGYTIEFSQCDKTWERVEIPEDKIKSRGVKTCRAHKTSFML